GSMTAVGVRMGDPRSTVIDEDVRIGDASVLYPSVQIYGDTVIGDDVTIHSFSRISNSTVGPRSTVLEGCVVVDSALGADVAIGRYARLGRGSWMAGRGRVGCAGVLKVFRVSDGYDERRME